MTCVFPVYGLSGTNDYRKCVFQIILNVWEIADVNICMCSKYLTWTPTIKHPNIGDVDGRGKRCPYVTYPFKENHVHVPCHYNVSKVDIKTTSY